MQIVVNISKEQYKKLKSTVTIGTGAEIIKAMRNGTVLPEGHGKLIDAGELKKKTGCMRDTYCDHKNCKTCQYCCVSQYEIDDAPAILEADKEANDD